MLSPKRYARLLADELKRQAPMMLTQAIQIEPTTELIAPETPQERILRRALVLTIERPIPQTPKAAWSLIFALFGCF